MYSLALLAHSWVRWIVLLAGVVAVGRAILGLTGGRPWTGADGRLARLFPVVLDVQTLIGLILYVVLSPFTRAAFGDMAAAMRNAGLRFYVVEHLVGMLVAVALAHVGSVRIKRSRTDAERHRYAAIFFGLALVAILLSIPWPGTPSGRPLFRF